MSETLDILLAGTARNVGKEPLTEKYKHRRLSKELGAPVVFDLKGLGYNVATSLAGSADMDIKIILEGVTAPDLKDARLAVKYGLLQPGEKWGDHGVLHKDLLVAMFTPGEIRAMSDAIQKLSGFSTTTLETVKKN